MKTKSLILVVVPVVVIAAGCGGSSSSVTPKPLGVVGIWTTTSTLQGSTYSQIDRLARPAVNELFATVANNRHAVNDGDEPANDKNELLNDMDGFLISPANRSKAIRQVIESVLVPDELKVDLSQPGAASYLGVETGGATGGKFGGRQLSDDVIDTSLGIVFGSTIPDLKLAPDDGNELPSFESDNVTDSGKHFLTTFPYVGNPQ
jgi:hypothetical protein